MSPNHARRDKGPQCKSSKSSAFPQGLGLSAPNQSQASRLLSHVSHTLSLSSKVSFSCLRNGGTFRARDSRFYTYFMCVQQTVALQYI
jgi:hypothetical protein